MRGAAGGRIVITRRNTSAALSALAVILAACAPKGGESASRAPPAASTPSSVPAAAGPAGEQVSGPEIPADQVPAVKAGLWEVTDTGSGAAPRTDRNCESGQRKPLSMGKECSRLTLHRTLSGGYVIDAECSSGAMTYGFHLVADGDFTNRYAVDSVSRFRKTPGDPEEVRTSRQEGRYVGACPATMTPED